MSIDSEIFGFWQPFWNTNDYGFKSNLYGTGLDVGVTFQTTVPHPFAGATGAQYIKLDGSQAHKLVLPGYSSTLSSSPTYRKARYLSCLIQCTSAPTADSIIMGATEGSTSALATIKIKTTRIIEYWYNGSSVANDLVSPPALPLNTNFQLEWWEVYTDASGNNLPNTHIVIRYIDLTTRAATVLFESSSTVAPVGGSWLTNSVYLGETTANGGTFYVGNPFWCRQDADNPIGIIRIEALHPDGVSGMANANQFPGTAGATTVDETPTAVPNDADYDAGLISGGVSPVMQRYTHQNRAVIAVADTVHALTFTARGYGSAADKGGSISAFSSIADGTTVSTTGIGATVTTTWLTIIAFWGLAPGSVSWTPTLVDSFEGGLQFQYGGATNSTIRISVATAEFLYVKSGETTPAIPADPTPPSGDSTGMGGTLLGLSHGIF